MTLKWLGPEMLLSWLFADRHLHLGSLGSGLAKLIFC